MIEQQLGGGKKGPQGKRAQGGEGASSRQDDWKKKASEGVWEQDSPKAEESVKWAIGGMALAAVGAGRRTRRT